MKEETIFTVRIDKETNKFIFEAKDYSKSYLTYEELIKEIKNYMEWLWDKYYLVKPI